MPYEYEHLDTERRQFRRLVLHPAQNHSDPIHVSLEIVEFEESVEYEALSYVWGPTTPAGHLFLNDSRISITPNLDCALRHLRNADSKRLLWVDALCINQEDMEEKVTQIKMMQVIYAFAVGVLVWLGPGTTQTDSAMRAIEKFDKQTWQTYEFQVNFMDIIYLDWFTRIWVVQEFVLGWNPKESPKIGCGTVWVPWISFWAAWAHFNDGLSTMQAEHDRLYRAAIEETFQPSWIDEVKKHPPAPRAVRSNNPLEERVLTGLRSAFGDDFASYTGHADVAQLFEDVQTHSALWIARANVMDHHAYEDAHAKNFYRRLDYYKRVPMQYCGFLMHARGTVAISRKSLTFTEILKGTMNLRSTNPRDKIYGILGLVGKDARAAIPIDYHKPPEWTFVPTMAYIIQNEPEGLSILGLIWQTRHFKTPIPSWVADFTVSAHFSDEHNPVMLRGSCSNAAWSWTQDVAISTDQTILTTSGISFGTVAHVLEMVDGSRSYFTERFHEIEDLIQTHCPASQEPLWRTLVGIRNGDADTCLPYPQAWEVLMGRAREVNGTPQKMFHDAILPIVKGRKFFITDKGFAGIATSMLRVGDTVVIIPGMVRCAVLREVHDPLNDLGIHVNVAEVEGAQERGFHRITGFAYVGCHDRKDFERREKDGLKDGWKEHQCLSGKMEKWHIV
ncbi:heterokaryon incompatibility protein-domain-containing protein [Paraphoma chrysanthemicola]|uniref:Heterokaryon incompatibility protein-domain-containing protein n=1 Tax=Paraphoma chrysanthemicola TaxID=798071 RepID=A0A8K0R709_9PLEO|nr:heterokaryon incompatibility protein-domain-containing protein [Paraphoma chrysanthemicola]